jgi:TIR domain
MARAKLPRAQPKNISGESLRSETDSISRSAKTLVFISHDSRDADMAEAFANLLTDVSAGTLKSFRSSDKKGTSGIEFGTEWYTAIMSQLDDATDVVALLTQRSIDRPWILYEAGVAKGKLDTNVLGIALGVPLDKVSSGPFGQFQNCADDEESLTKLVMQLLNRNPDAAPRQEAVQRQVKVFSEAAAKILQEKGSKLSIGSASTDESNIAKLFEETKIMIRELPSRVDDRVRSASRRNGVKFGRRFHPMVFDELIENPNFSKEGHGASFAWLIFISMIRDDIPWLYECGLDMYRAMQSKKAQDIISAHERFMQLSEMTFHGPLLHELFDRKDDEFQFFYRMIPEILNRLMNRVMRERDVLSSSKRTRPSISGKQEEI